MVAPDPSPGDAAPPDASPATPPPPPAAGASIEPPPLPADAVAPTTGAAATAASVDPAVATPPPSPLPPPEPAGAPFSFHGSANEYFRIWIVNALLTLLTVGVFAAWAKVRKRRYLRGNTEFLGHRFDYTADPRRLLIGNAIICALFLAYGLFGTVYPTVRLGALVVFILMLPWIVVRSLCFNAHHTVYRGLRFRFHPSLSAATMTYLLRPLLLVPTLGLYFPEWARRRTMFSIDRHRLGTAYFSVQIRSGAFYGVYFTGGLVGFLGGVVLAIYSGIFVALHPGRVPNYTQLAPALVIYGALLYLAKHVVFAGTFREIWNNTKLDQHRFRTTLQTKPWLKLQATNLLAIVFSLGLAYPWALIRSTKYVVSSLELIPAGPLEDIKRMDSTSGSAVGDTAAEFAGLDFGL